jgi:sulfoxide reductase catalytic subunit YedY
LNRLLDLVEPAPDARYVRFESVYDPDQMPGQRPGAYEKEAVGEDGMGARVKSPYKWPYVEGLRLDEAMHDLTFFATGMYGGDLHPANGAPARILVPWKYSFKSPKAVVKIDLVADQPATFWHSAIPEEYPFYANVNPDVPHPHWEQVKEVRYRGACPEPIVPTIMYNGYGDQVAHMYVGMDPGA